MENKPMSVLLASGGLDSTTLAYWMISQGIEFIPVFIDYGQHCSNTELSTLHEVLPRYHRDSVVVIDVSDVYNRSKSLLIREVDLWNEKVSYLDMYLPYRSLLLFSIGSAFAQSNGLNTVYSAFINSNHAKEIDCSAKFFESMEDILNGFGGVKLVMPFRYFSKYEVAKVGIELKAPIGKTFSCQASSIIPCGACPNCIDRLEAIKMLSSSKT